MIRKSPKGLAVAMVVGLVSMKLVRPAPRPAYLAADGRDAVEHFLERHAVFSCDAQLANLLPLPTLQVAQRVLRLPSRVLPPFDQGTT